MGWAGVGGWSGAWGGAWTGAWGSAGEAQPSVTPIPPSVRGVRTTAPAIAAGTRTTGEG